LDLSRFSGTFPRSQVRQSSGIYLVRDAPVPACQNGVDDDDDGEIDFPADTGCETPTSPIEKSELMACDDARDNDGDGQVDFPDDPGCASLTDQSEGRVRCGLGFEAALALAMALGLARRLRGGLQ
jgi:hypothetical protein